MTNIYLVRHAEAEGNLFRRINGQYDANITYLGYKQIEALCKKMQSMDINKIFSSDLKRAKTTAIILSNILKLPTTFYKELREINMGRWENKPWGNIMKEDFGNYTKFINDIEHFAIEGSETYEVIINRFCNILNKIVNENEGENIVIVSHGTIIKCFLSFLLNKKVIQTNDLFPTNDNTSITQIKVENNIFTIISIYDTSHITKEISTTARQIKWRTLNKFSDGLYLENKDNETTTATINNRQIGKILYDINETSSELIIKLIYIENSYRKQRFGVQLIGEVVDICHKQGYKRIKVTLKDNDNALFFIKSGFKEDLHNTYIYDL